MTGKDVHQSDQMTERELVILKMRFGIDMPNQESWTLHQTAKVFNISYERVRQIEVRALKKLRISTNTIKIDGPKIFNLNEKTFFVKKGDQKSVTIAAASIIAKCYRDSVIKKLAVIHPFYEWEKNKGYGTKKHFNASKILTGVELKEFSLIYLVMTNLDMIQKNIHLKSCH